MTKQEYDKIIKEGDVVKRLINTSLTFRIGSGVTSVLPQFVNEACIIDTFKSVIRTCFIDWEYYYNYCSDQVLYKEVFNRDVLEVFLSDLDKFFKDYITHVPSYLHREADAMGIKKVDVYEFTSKTICKGLKSEYSKYLKK